MTAEPSRHCVPWPSHGTRRRRRYEEEVRGGGGAVEVRRRFDTVKVLVGI
jgi:hypothetical protein